LNLRAVAAMLALNVTPQRGDIPEPLQENA
jgi:hypothetical protein